MTTFSGLLFDLDEPGELGRSVAEHLGIEPAPHELRQFEAGEHKSRPLLNVRDRNAYVLSSLAGDEQLSANDKLCRLLFFVGALNEASVGSVTAVVPYLCYSRKDRQTKARDPVTTRYVAQLFEAVGTDRLMTLDVHNLAAFQNAARGRTDHLEATQLFVQHVQSELSGADLVVVSPDVGGMKRAERFRQQLEGAVGRSIELAFTGKHRSRGVISGPNHVLGDVENKVAVVLDDIISSGGTMVRVAEMLARQGAAEVHLAATHGHFTPPADSLLTSESVTSVIITDSIQPIRLSPERFGPKLVVLGCGSLLGEAISRIDTGGSIVDLLQLDL